MNAGEKAAAYQAKFNNPNARIVTMAAAVKVMNAEKDHEDREQAIKFIHEAIAYYATTAIDGSDGMSLQDWIIDGDWTGKISTAKQLAADYDAR
jgi:hypothetical protein